VTAGLTLRLATAADLAAAALLHNAAFPDDPWSPESFAALLAQPGVSLWLACSGGPPKGLILLRQVLDEAEILTFAVDPGFRRQGIGRALLGQAATALSAAGVVKLYLEVAEDNPSAIFTYESTGFIRTGMRPAYYKRGLSLVNAILMAKEIKPLLDHPV